MQLEIKLGGTFDASSISMITHLANYYEFCTGFADIFDVPHTEAGIRTTLESGTFYYSSSSVSSIRYLTDSLEELNVSYDIVRSTEHPGEASTMRLRSMAGGTPRYHNCDSLGELTFPESVVSAILADPTSKASKLAAEVIEFFNQELETAVK